MIRKFSIAFCACLAWAVLFAFRARAAGPDSAATTRAMRVWHVADGLPSDSVTAIIQTRDGFMWIGTDAGLVRFDGVKFSELALAASTTNTTFHITALCQDSNGNVWIGTQNTGLFEVTAGRTRHFTTVLLDPDVTSLAADSSGNVWVGTKSGLNFWNAKEFKGFTTRDGLPDEFITGINVARSGTVWITTRVGMCRFINHRIVPYAFQTQSQGRSPEYLGAYEDRRGNLWAFGDTYLINLAEGKRFNYFRSSESASVRIWSLCEGRDGRLWIGTSGRGLFCFDDNRFEPVLFGGERWPYDVRAICEDNEGDLWLGTSGGGLIQLRPESAYILHQEQGLPDSPVTALASDAAGNIYLGLERGGLFVGQSGRFDEVEIPGNLAIQNYVSSVSVGRDGSVWAGTLGAGLFGLRNGREINLTTADGLADNNVVVVCCGAGGDVWFSSETGGLYHWAGDNLVHFDSIAGFNQSAITAIAPTAAGGVWLGTQDGQVIREDDGHFTPVRDNSAHTPVLALFEAQPDQLWVGTAGDGLSCVANGRVFNWNTSTGLPSDVVAGIVEDGGNNLWLATSAGIFRVNRGDAESALARENVPLTCQLVSNAKTILDPAAVSSGSRAVYSPDGLLWFATSDGVLNVDTRNPVMLHHAFPVYIESVAFNGRAPVSLLDRSAQAAGSSASAPFKAPVDLRSLEFQFTGLSFSMPEEIQFRHRLEGNDPDWIDDAGARVARYGRLPWGHYVFRVEARSPDGTWQAAKTFAFVVPTPLYFQRWVLALYVLAAIALVASTVRMVSHRRLRVRLARLEQQQSLERERMRIARDMHDEMGSKLTKISFLSERAQVEAKSGKLLADKIDSIAQTSRDLLKTMDEIVWAVNPRNDTLENLASYLAHYATEYFQGTSVECELRLPREVPHYALSSETRHNLFLAFEEALNNVLKHSAATKVKVEMNTSVREFELKVADNGKGFEAVAVPAAQDSTRGGRGGNGLKNMRQRMAAIGGQCLVSSGNEGTVIAMRIPLNPKTLSNS